MPNSFMHHVTINETNFELRDQEVRNAFSEQSIIPAVGVIIGFYKTENGEYLNNTAYRTTDYISVLPGEKYIFRTNASSAAYSITMFDSNKNLLPNVSIPGTGSRQTLVFTIPEGVDYIKFTGAYQYVDAWVLSKSTNLDQVNASMNLLNTYINMNGYGVKYAPELSWVNGGILASDGSTNTVNTYKNSNFIPVHPGMRYTITSTASSSFFMLGMYATNSGNADLSKSVKGVNATLETVDGVIPEGINYVKVCSTTAALQDVVFKLYTNNCIDLQKELDELVIRLGKAYVPDIEWNGGYVTSSDGSIVSASSIYYSNMVPVEAGQVFHVTSFGSSSVLIVASYKNQTDTNADVIRSVRGYSSSNLTYIDGIIPNGVKFVRFVCYKDYISDFSVTIQSKPYEYNTSKIYSNKKVLSNARRPVIGFILDKDFQHNRAMKDVFVSHGAPFSVALSYNTDSFVNTSLPEYLYWEEFNNFEMLTHGSYALPNTDTYTDDQVKGFVNDSYDTLVGYGFNPKGYIAGSGLMADHYIPFVQNKYNWASTRANHSGSDEPCIIFGTDAPYKLWRYSLQISTLTEMKAAVDKVILDGALLLFYGHAQDGQLQNFTTENLDALLTYIESKDCNIMCPTDAIESFFTIRYDDIYPNS